MSGMSHYRIIGVLLFGALLWEETVNRSNTIELHKMIVLSFSMGWLMNSYMRFVYAFIDDPAPFVRLFWRAVGRVVALYRKVRPA
jgi:hypothetical protein